MIVEMRKAIILPMHQHRITWGIQDKQHTLFNKSYHIYLKWKNHQLMILNH